MGKLSSKQGSVFVAVNFDESAERLVQCAAALCRTTGMTLTLKHVSEPVFRNYVKYVEPLAALKPEIFQSIEDDAITIAESRLREIAQGVKGVTPETEVIVGHVAESLLGAIKSSGASVVIVGAAKGSHKLLMRGFSTAMALMNECPVPVIVVPGGAAVDFAREHFRLMVADDLRDETAPAVESTFELAERLKASEVLQLHVSSMTEDLFKTTMEGALAAARNAGDVSVSELWSIAQEKMTTRATQRATPQKMAFRTAGGRIKALCEAGPLQEEIMRNVSSYKPDLVVFGRHERLHSHSMAYGQLPLHMMLALERPIMIVPNATKNGR